MIASMPIGLRRVSSQLKKYKQVCDEEGYDGFAWVAKDFLQKVRKGLFSVEYLYVYEIRLDGVNEIPQAKAKIDGLSVKPIFLPITLQEYEYLGNEGVDYEKLPGARIYEKGIGQGTIVFLTYKGDTLMNRTGMTLYRNGAYVLAYPASLDKGKTVYAGFSETTKTARMMGIYSYVHSYIFRYLKGMDFENVILLESEEQPGPRKVQDRLGAKILFTTRCSRILMLFSFWKVDKYIKLDPYFLRS